MAKAMGLYFPHSFTLYESLLSQRLSLAGLEAAAMLRSLLEAP